ncbi:protein Wnt-16-like [Tubulanus polymorphus]|uniref:protein Wnt-16-like n=1 Tax=Tubulanus polymorphus TaxID=672921 RepID=UPI003DA2289A
MKTLKILSMGRLRRIYSLIIYATLLTCTRQNWLYLGVASIASANQDACNLVPGLVRQQQEVCRANPRAIPCIGYGARQGIGECQYQFRGERWNCTATRQFSVFGPMLTTGTRETAFIHGITSAGVVHAVTQSCNAGNLTDCSCDMSKAGMRTADGWQWGGCNDNINYGVWFAKAFVDAPDIFDPVTGVGVKNMANLHNNEVGRQVIVDAMKLVCRCHGVSGSCSVRTCWKRMPQFRHVGNIMKSRYEQAVRVAQRSKRKLRRKDRTKRRVPIPKDTLVFYEHSPNYCKRDTRKGVFGTRGRRCDKNAKGSHNCEVLCCGRGYNTEMIQTVRRCRCKFVWCCQVKCKICKTVHEKYTCK